MVAGFVDSPVLVDRLEVAGSLIYKKGIIKF